MGCWVHSVMSQAQLRILERNNMDRKSLTSAVSPVCLALQVAILCGPAFGGDALGALGGITRDSNGQGPVPETNVVARGLDTNTVRTVALFAAVRPSEVLPLSAGSMSYSFATFSSGSPIMG